MESLQQAKLEPFLLIAKGSRGAGLKRSIEQATAAPGVFVFSELLSLPSVRALEKDAELSAWYQLLVLFAYGTLATYKESSASYPPLNPAQINKLKHLTIVSLARSSRTIPYALLLSTLDLATVRELEDFLIDGMYHGLIKGKMDQQRACFLVDDCLGRDVSPQELDVLHSVLSAWASNQTNLISTLSDTITRAQGSSSSYQSSLLKYQIERDATAAEAARLTANERGGGFPNGAGAGAGTRSSWGGIGWGSSGGGGDDNGGSTGAAGGGSSGTGGGDASKKGKKPPPPASSGTARKKNRN